MRQLRSDNRFDRDQPATCHCRLPAPLGGLTVLHQAGRVLEAWFDSPGDKPLPASDLTMFPTDSPPDPLSDSFPDSLTDLLSDPMTHARTNALLAEWISAWQHGTARPADPLPFVLSLQGTPFQQEVWRAIQAIPRGQVMTYSALAALIGRPSAVRAVAAACGANRLALFIPCHRVVASDGGLAGFRWGIGRKQALLAAESLPLSEDACGRWRVSLPAPDANR